MKKIDPTVWKETAYVAAVVLILSLIMQIAVFAVSFWKISFVWGNLLGAAAAVGNFFLMGLTVQKALDKKDEKEVKNFVKLSQGLRMLILLAVALVGCLVPCFHPVAVILPLLFPRIAVTLRGLQMKK